MECGVGSQPHKTPHFHPRWHRHPLPLERPSQEEPGSDSTASAPVSGVSDHACANWYVLLHGLWVRLRRTTYDHVVLQCPIHRPPHGLHDLTVLDDETIEWLLNNCPEIWCGQAVVRTTTGSKEEECFIKTCNLQKVYAYVDDITVTGANFAEDYKKSEFLACHCG